MDPRLQRGKDLLQRAVNSDIPIGALMAISELRRFLDDLEVTTVEQARSKGATWQQMARRLGVSRQALHERVGRLRAPGRQRLTSRTPLVELLILT